MKDLRKRGICRILIFTVALAMMTAGCRRENADQLTELELGQDKRESEGLTDGDDKEDSHKKPEAKENAQENGSRQGQEVKDIAYVYVCGAVNAPGVYELASDARVYEAIALAGGTCENAAADALNQASVVTDGERIYIPTREELEKGIVDLKEPEVTGADNKNEGKININTASKEELKSLPGIGDAKADSIITYREANGPFQAIEDMMNIEGIKEGVFNKIKDKIIVTS